MDRFQKYSASVVTLEVIFIQIQNIEDYYRQAILFAWQFKVRRNIVLPDCVFVEDFLKIIVHFNKLMRQPFNGYVKLCFF